MVEVDLHGSSAAEEGYVEHQPFPAPAPAPEIDHEPLNTGERPAKYAHPLAAAIGACIQSDPHVPELRQEHALGGYWHDPGNGPGGNRSPRTSPSRQAKT